VEQQEENGDRPLAQTKGRWEKPKRTRIAEWAGHRSNRHDSGEKILVLKARAALTNKMLDGIALQTERGTFLPTDLGAIIVELNRPNVHQ
jgi:hypothetical protein